MADPSAPPKFVTLSPTMRVDVMISDWRAMLLPELTNEEKERRLYEAAFQEYLGGDYGFGLWCWFECDRLTNALGGSVREVTRVLGPGRYFGFSHRKAIAGQVPIDRIYRPRKGDMSTPRTDAFVLAPYQLLCVYLVRAHAGDPKAKALLEIAIGELEERRRADPFIPHFDTFRRLLERPPPGAAPPTPPPIGAAAEIAVPPKPSPKRRSASRK